MKNNFCVSPINPIKVNDKLENKFENKLENKFENKLENKFENKLENKHKGKDEGLMYDRFKYFHAL